MLSPLIFGVTQLPAKMLKGDIRPGAFLVMMQVPKVVPAVRLRQVRNDMPVVFRWQGYRFFFFSNEGDPLEPIHVHSRKGDKVAKCWVRPGVGLADSHGMTTTELKLLTQAVEAHAELIERRWHEHFDH